MKKEHEPVPKPTSKFHKVECRECGETQVVYSHASTAVTCNSCGNKIAEPTGALAKIHGKVSGNAD